MASDKQQERPRRVLVMRFSALGDVALTIPVVYEVCRANPDVEFVLATMTWPATMMVDAPANLTVVDVDVKGRYKGLRGMWKLAKKVDKHFHVDAVADLHSVIRSWAVDLWMKLHHRRVARIDKGREKKRALISGKIHEQLTTTIDRYRKVFQELGLTVPENTFEGLYHGKTMPTSAIVPAKSPGERWIAVAPFAAHKGKQYPIEQMNEVIGLLAAIEGARLFLFGGGKAEKLALRPLAKRYFNVTSLAEVKHAFLDEFVLMSQCEVMLSMDSANMHLASLVGLPVVSVWGATHPYCGFMGYRQKHDNVVQLDLPCRPCSVFGENKCRFGDYHCMTDIAPETIVAKVKQLLKIE